MAIECFELYQDEKIEITYKVVNDDNEEIQSNYEGRKYLLVTNIDQLDCLTRLSSVCLGTLGVVFTFGLSLCTQTGRAFFIDKENHILIKVEIYKGETAEDKFTQFCKRKEIFEKYSLRSDVLNLL